MALWSAVWGSFGIMSMGVGGTTGVGTVGTEVLDNALGLPMAKLSLALAAIAALRLKGLGRSGNSDGGNGLSKSATD